MLGGTVGCIKGCIDGGRCDMVGAGAAGGYAIGVVGGQHRGGPTTSLLGMGLSILPTVPAGDPVVVDADVGTGGIGAVGKDGGARSLNNAALHCSRAPGMCNKCVASNTL